MTKYRGNLVRDETTYYKNETIYYYITLKRSMYHQADDLVETEGFSEKYVRVL